MKHITKRVVILILALAGIFIVSLSILFIPQPYYLSQDSYCESYPPVLCQKKGWHLKTSLYNKLTGQDRQTAQHTVLPPSSPRPNFIEKPYGPPCYLEKVLCMVPPCNPILMCESLPKIIYSAKDDLAKQLKVPNMDIVVASLQEIQWISGSLGCPEPGKLYTQAIVPGYQVIFEYQNKQYEYHTDKSKLFVIC